MSAVTDNIFFLVFAGTGGAFLLVIAFIALHMRNQNHLLQEREMAQEKEIEHQKNLLSTVIRSQEAERKRIGQDLHDDVGAALSRLRLKVDMFNAADITPMDFKAFAQSCKQEIDHIVTDVRHISHNLSPPRLALFGLNAALEDLTDVIPRSGLKLLLDNQAMDTIGHLDLTIATALYRIFEELIQNTIKHAAASSIRINIYTEAGKLVLGYADDGIGLNSADPKKAGMGMQNMESRLSMINATYRLGEADQRGFSIHITCPLAL
ncbi:sensor histidine kinase [Mucilaginibacter myungsuensis]|uniref:histidine kinase n=1 Tax=Mucilaginibacter myungsuensis TaxID=649104 RepID=A0A929KVH2_9SPHI|nr:histidine kinase [Mucilaginibacter myungsuensis]MBE9661902.1 hypothetical protein [Mucilaginibacter myungsuensis]MDN3599664.1 histidine kinase [Mucilaginibacter myungsuensis]